MLQNLGDHIKTCNEYAAKAQQRAEATSDPELKNDYIALASQWEHLARSYEFAVSLERFLLDAQKAKDAQEPQAPTRLP
jgi:hypothetical protein